MAVQGIDIVSHWRNRTVVSADGGVAGRITEIYLDDRDDQPRWALIGSPDDSDHLVPISEAIERETAVHVPYDLAVVIAARGMAPAGGLSEDEEAELFSHYGLDYEPRPIELDRPELSQVAHPVDRERARG
jgi:hypothetical protein